YVRTQVFSEDDFSLPEHYGGMLVKLTSDSESGICGLSVSQLRTDYVTETASVSVCYCAGRVTVSESVTVYVSVHY
ncbi:hypothetical protein BaRGS_00037942, partial [Batillaria attramentaria]